MTDKAIRARTKSRDGAPVVPEATFTSYYGRPVVKAAPWEADIPAYLFFGGLSAASSLLAAGADLTGRPALRRTGRLGAMAGISLGLASLVHDLGKPSRFVNMLRVAKPTSPMSVGTWMLTMYGPQAGIAGAAELPGFHWLGRFARPAGLGAAAFAPMISCYTAVLLADTATPSWHEARRELPFVFAGSSACAASGLAMVATPGDDAGPARRLAVAGAAVELLAERRMEQSMGRAAEPLRTGLAGRLMLASRALTGFGATAAALGGRSRVLSMLGGAALVAASAATRFGVFEAGRASADDPKYTVVPQRERLNARS